MTPDKKPGVAFWTTLVVVVVLVAYPLSFGPACWLNERGFVAADAIAAVYSPVLAFAENGRLPVLIDWYACRGAKPDDIPVVINKTITWKSEWERVDRLTLRRAVAPRP